MLSNLLKFPFWVEKAWAATEMEQPDTVILLDDGDDGEHRDAQAFLAAESTARPS